MALLALHQIPLISSWTQQEIKGNVACIDAVLPVIPLMQHPHDLVILIIFQLEYR
jgi:hypothetical protein